MKENVYSNKINIRSINIIDLAGAKWQHKTRINLTCFSVSLLGNNSSFIYFICYVLGILTKNYKDKRKFILLQLSLMQVKEMEMKL